MFDFRLWSVFQIPQQDPLQAARMPPEMKAEVNIMPKVTQGDLESLPPEAREFIESNAKLCQPENIHICDGSEEENKKILDIMVEQGMIKKLSKYENWWVA